MADLDPVCKRLKNSSYIWEGVFVHRNASSMHLRDEKLFMQGIFYQIRNSWQVDSGGLFQKGYQVSWMKECGLSIKLFLFVSSAFSSPGRHSTSSQVAYLLVRQCSFPSAALQPQLTDDWLAVLHSSALIVLKRSCSVRPKIGFPWAREGRGGDTD